ncbi:hypothetical protein GCM10007096_11370 [Pullulanibacillus pueri]|uniref:Uncharacterized protein n=1 Tax=Pullulanibacillus pueri TaxID=1437324 RepID=A0A8J2ZTU8_9BACL|nr:hypothetical protein GCM10007096_11370 [Pullulanibacillus pueri]
MDRMLILADSAENGFFGKGFFFPYLDGMILSFVVTVIARIILLTTFKLDGDNITFGSVMSTTRFCINESSINFGHFFSSFVF